MGLFTILPNESFICFICTESLTFNAFNDSIIFAELELNEFIFNVRGLDVPGRGSPDSDTPDPDLEVEVTLSSLPSIGFARDTECELKEEVPLLKESNPLVLRLSSFGLAFTIERAQADDFFERVESVLDALEPFLGLSPILSPAVWVT